MRQLAPCLYAPLIRLPAKRHFSAILATPPGEVKTIKLPQLEVTTFRRNADDKQSAPVLFVKEIDEGKTAGRKSPALPLPAVNKWFVHPSDDGHRGNWRDGHLRRALERGTDSRGRTPEDTKYNERYLPKIYRQLQGFKDDQPSRDLSPFFRQHLAATVPYELMLGKLDPPDLVTRSFVAFLQWLRKSEDSVHQSLFTQLDHVIPLEQLQNGRFPTDFVRFEAPLALFDAAMDFNLTRKDVFQRVSQLYIAQLSLSELPKELRRDLPTPRFLRAPPTKRAPFTGDIYNSSLWLGLEPLFTPWHRDPNPNLFCQLVGTKVVRLMPPQAGEALFREVMATLGKPGASAAIRGEEMMQAAERGAWWDAVWGRDPPEMVEAVVNYGEMLFIPKGWWHSVRSKDSIGRVLNASVNWWFRWRRPVDRGGQANTPFTRRASKISHPAIRHIAGIPLHKN